MAIYVAGVIDGSSSIGVSIAKDNTFRLGHRIVPIIQIKRKNPDLPYLIDDWARQLGVSGNIQDKESSTQFKISTRDGAKRFLEELVPYLLVHDNAAEIILNEIIPRLENGDHRTKEGFLEIIEYVEMAREHGASGSEKYDREYFEELWEDDLSQS